MKTCKSCRKEIESKASKCAFCQSYQVWYRNPQLYGFIIALPMFVVIFWNSGLFNQKNFIDYEPKFKIAVEKVISANDPRYTLFTYKVINDTDYKWSRINYQVVSKQDGELLSSMTGSDYSWVIQPNSESLLTVRVANVPNANQWFFEIKDLKSDPYY